MRPGSSGLAALTCIFLCLAGCGHHSDDHAQHEAGHESHASELQLTLDEGKKWQVDEHTRLSAARITEILSGAEAIHSADDARALAEQLDGELKNLVNGCTMTGSAHDQLHVVLVALFPKVEALKNKTDVADLRGVRAEIGSVLATYESHFE